MNPTRGTMVVRIVNIKNISLHLPYYHSVSAGFPSPADDYLESNLSLDEHLIKNPSSTFFVRVEGYSMTGAGIQDGDIIVVDRSLKAQLNQIVVAIIGGDFTVKQLIRKANKYYLRAAHPDYPDLLIDNHNDFMVWGVVTFTIHKANI